jgi:outer membrane receptor for ferrienterochelin and colicin
LLRDTLGESATDGDFQYHFTGGARQDFVSGVAYRHSTLNFRDGYATSFNPGNPTTNLFSTFLQDEIRLTGSVALTVGSKFEHNDYSGFEGMPIEGRPSIVTVRGKIQARDGQFVGDQSRGRLLRREPTHG